VQTIEYLDVIAQEAEKLAAVWREQFGKLVGLLLDEHTDGKKRFDEKRECLMLMQRFHYDSLVFYSQSFDSVFKGKPDSKDLEQFKKELMAILMSRETSFEAAETLDDLDIVPPDHDNHRVLGELRATIMQMQSQAARLRVIANAFKAAK
jgi:hypothetical protein